MAASLTIGGDILSIAIHKHDESGKNIVMLKIGVGASSDPIGWSEVTVGFCVPAGKTLALVDEVAP